MGNPFSLGTIKPSVGSPLPLAFNHPEFSHDIVNSIYVQVLPENTGGVWIGSLTMNKSSGVGVIAYLPPPTLNSIPDIFWDIPGAPNPLLISDYYVDVDVPGDGIRANFTQA